MFGFPRQELISLHTAAELLADPERRVLPRESGTGRLACDVGSDLMVAQFLDECFAVIAFVGTHGHPSPACNLFHQLKGGLGFGAPAGLVDASSHGQALAIVHPHVPGVAELGLLTRCLTCQAGFRIGGGLMGSVAERLAVKVDARIALIIIVRRLNTILALETLVPGPRLDERAVDREVLIAEQPLATGLLDH